MDRIRRVFHPQQPYEPIDGRRDGTGISGDGSEDAFEPEENPFSQVEYWIFLLMGVAMLWAWNMFLAAAPYFQYRFASDQWILAHFQSVEMSISTVTNLGSMLVLTNLQKNASYPYRIASSLCINIICFALLSLSTLVTTSAGVYLGFLMLMVFSASLATGLIQNGLFAYVAGFGRSEYTQAIMTGQAVAGVLPCLAQIGTVLAVPEKNQQSPNQTPTESPTSAFAYFLTATAVSAITLIAFLYLLRRRRSTTLSRTIQSPAHKPTTTIITNGISEGDHDTSPIINPPPSPNPEEQEHPAKPNPNPKTPIPLTHLLRLLPTFSAAVFLTFALTMIYPVFTIRIHSLNPTLLPSSLFIPLAFLVWNVGDLIGRLLPLLPSLRLTHRPSLLLLLSLLRLIFVPLYLLCNIGGGGADGGGGGGAKVKSDFFYLGVVQLWFGVSNGYVGSSCMMGASEWVAEDEREAAGSWMGLCLVAGLTVGSLLSFLVGGA